MPCVPPTRSRRHCPHPRAAGVGAAIWLAAAAAFAQVRIGPAETPAAPPKVLRYSMNVAETGFDPAQVADAYSREIIDNIIEPPLRYDLLARPLKLRTATAAALPEMSADFRELTLRVRPGIFFADDPAFHGRPRELTAGDYAYALRRHFDPRLHSVAYADLLGDDILGLQALRERAENRALPFDYDSPVEGLRVTDRYTLHIRFGHPSPRFPLKLAQTIYAGAIARELAELYGDAIMEHPVGTGPYRLVQWRRSSFIALERNLRFREELYDEQPAAGDADGQATAVRLRGRREPMIDRVEVSVIEEAQPSWLAYVGGAFDMTLVPYEFAGTAAPGGRLAPALAQRGMRLHSVAQSDVIYTYFNMEDPVVGGYSPEHVGLRRAIALGYDNAEEIRLLRKPLAIPAQGLVAPLVAGYDPDYRSAMGDYDPARARALLDLFGYADRDGDGYRERPNGGALVLHMATQPDTTARQLNELWQKKMDAIGLRIVFDRRQWPEQMKQSRAGRLQMWTLGGSSDEPDPEDLLALAYGPSKGAGNWSRFDLPDYNVDFRRIHELPDGPERAAAIARAQKLLLAYMPMKTHLHRVRLILTQPWLVGYPANPFVNGFWRYLDIDAAQRPATQ
ncbi:MAG: ABC transporter substrate-binding protein [Betaproteobacteria bacterium]